MWFICHTLGSYKLATQMLASFACEKITVYEQLKVLFFINMLMIFPDTGLCFNFLSEGRVGVW